MTYDHELELVKETYVTDDIGNQIPVEEKTEVYCNVKSIGRNEFYNASTSDLKPEIVFTIHGYEYDNQNKVIFEGIQYSVIRTYRVAFEEIELICQRLGVDVGGQH